MFTRFNINRIFVVLVLIFDFATHVEYNVAACIISNNIICMSKLLINFNLITQPIHKLLLLLHVYLIYLHTL